MQVSEKIEAYLAARITLPELEDALSEIVAGEDSIETARQLLQVAFESGKLPQQVYHLLIDRLANFYQGESTRIAPSPVTNEATRVKLPPADSTRTAPVSPQAGTTEPVFKESTKIVSDMYPPSLSVSGTASNWTNPEEWSDSGLGPIGPGTVIRKRFRIESRLGQGGMGEVFKALDLRKQEAQDSDPYVAIKILNDEFRGHPKALISLQREASKAQLLAHPNVITVYDFDRDGTTVFMTMELMRGEPLDELVKKYDYVGMQPNDALPLIMGMAEGLAYAHEQEIVHSDFKPANVFLTSDGRVKVLDFGIARATKAAIGTRAEDKVFDAGDLGALTPPYASLEMLQGEDPHPSDDVYALAVTAYMLLTGEHPFGRKSAERALLENLKPKPIKNITRRQWATIRDGLALRREDRTIDAGSFCRQLRGPTPVKKSIHAAIVLLAVLAIFFGYRSTLDLPGPFPEDQREKFEEIMTEGKSFLKYGLEDRNIDDLWTAAVRFGEAYQIHPRNPQASDALERAADAALEFTLDARLAETVDNLVCRGHLRSYSPIESACEDLGENYCRNVIETNCPED